MTVALAQWRTILSLRAQLAELRSQRGTWLRVQAEHQKLLRLQISENARDRLRSDHAAIARLRGEIEMLRRQAEESHPAASPVPPEDGPAISGRTILNETLPVRLWTNAGSASPTASLETVLWAAAAGDIAMMVRHFLFEPEASVQAAILFQKLPAADQARYGSPDRLIASLSAKNVPLGLARIIDLKTKQDGSVLLATELSEPTGKTHLSLFRLRQEGAAWKLVVRPEVIEKYAAFLAKPAAETAGK